MAIFPAENQTLADQLLMYTRAEALKIGLITEDALAQYNTLNTAARNYNGAQKKDQKLNVLISDAAHFAPDDKLAMAQLMSAETIVLNALSNMDNARMVPDAYARFVTLFKNGLLSNEPEAFIELLKETQEKMLISIVQTIHPTIYHNELGRQVEGTLTQILEQMVGATNRDAPVAANSEKFDEAKRCIDAMLQNLKDGKQVTRNEQVTVSQENNVEQENFQAMKVALSKVVDAYNKALRDIMKPGKIPSDLVSVSEREKLVGMITPERMSSLADCAIDEHKVEFRTWARAADADGRDKATSIELYRAIHRPSELDSTAKYIGPRLDCRENKRQHEEFVSAAIQANYRQDIRDSDNTSFRAFCDRFDETHENGNNPNWGGSRKSVFLQLSEGNKAEFLKQLIVSDFHLVPSELKADTIAFNQMFASEYTLFLAEHGALIEKARPGIPLESISLENLNDIKEYSPEHPQGRSLSLALRQRINEKLFEKKKYVLNDDFTYECDQYNWYRNIFNTVSTIETHKNGGGQEFSEKRELWPHERKKLLDVIKRLQILDDGITKHGKGVSDRYQIANFEKEADFYAAMLLFKEAGILEIKDGKVAQDPAPKLSIQPLLETAKDMADAPEMFRKLLEDPLALSYYQACGNQANIMLGFSDGAKSAGNLASEYAIYKCAEELHTIFAKKGIALRVFQGRGRGPDRGGQFEEGHDQLMMPPSVQERMILDVTLQADKPMDMAISPAAAQDTLASMITGTINARKAADQWKSLPEATRTLLEEAVTFITQESENGYCRLVSDNPQTLKFIAGMPNNPFITSRKLARGGAIKDFVSTRAITVEYGGNLADAPLHNVGVKSALQKFISEGKTIPGKDGKPVTGVKALEMLYELHPIFRGSMDKIEVGMQNYDPAIFASYAKAFGVESWADECIRELNGTRELAMNISNNVSRNYIHDAAAKTGINVLWRTPKHEGLSWAQYGYAMRENDVLATHKDRLDTAAHGLALSMAVKEGEIATNPKIFKLGHESTAAQSLQILLFTLSAEVGHRGKSRAISQRVDGVGR